MSSGGWYRCQNQGFFDTSRQALRTALFPLISGQHKRRAFFEPPDWPADCPPPDDAEVWACSYTPTYIKPVTQMMSVT